MRAIELENFKCFGRPARVPLAPITLIFGQNSAGKSAILKLCIPLRDLARGARGTSRCCSE